MFVEPGGGRRTAVNDESTRPQRTEVLGCPIDPLTLTESLELLASWVEDDSVPKFHLSMNAAKIQRSQREDVLRQAWTRADLVSADGMGVVWASRGGLPERVPGIDLCEGLLTMSERRGWRPYLVGGRPEVMEDVIACVEVRWPDLSLAGHHHGYFPDEERVDLVASIAQVKPDLLLVGMGSPRQEAFLLDAYLTIGAAISMGVGGTWDVLSGHIKRAPRPIRDRGLEWAWRMTQEPHRIWSKRTWDTAFFGARALPRWFGKKIS